MVTGPTDPTDPNDPAEPTDSTNSSSATPTAFEFLKALLPGYPPELVPLFVLAYDIDAFEADAANFTKQTGIPESELLAIAAEARKGSDPMADKRPGQHVVSRSVLVAWCTGANRQNQLIWPYSLHAGRESPTNPSDVGKVYDFVKVDSKRTEQEWEPVENKLRQAVADIENGTGFADPACVQTIKEVIALHYARSIETLETVEKLFDTTIENKKAAMLRQPEDLDRLYEAKTGDATGLKDDDAREAFVDAFHGRLRWIFNSGTYFRFRVVYLFHAALDLIAPMKVQVLRAPPGSEFLISDAPVITADASSNRRGVRDNIAIGNADSVLMPLSPHVTVALDNLAGDFPVDAAYVRKLNTWQLEAAKHHVFLHPSSSLMSWVEVMRPATPPTTV